LNLGARWGWVVNTTPWPLFPRKGALVPLVQEAEWDTVPIWMSVPLVQEAEWDTVPIWMSVPLVQEAEWDTVPIWMSGQKRKSLFSTNVQASNCPSCSKSLY